MKIICLWLFGLICIIPVSVAQSSFDATGSSFEAHFLDRINSLRERGCTCGTTYMPPVPPLVWNKKLENAARGHAIDMARHHYFSHESLNGKDLRARAVSAGYGYKGYHRYAVGENIALGQRSIDEVMDGWIESEGHCRNLMNERFKEVGVFEINHYWVQDFGGREGF